MYTSMHILWKVYINDEPFMQSQNQSQDSWSISTVCSSFCTSVTNNSLFKCMTCGHCFGCLNDTGKMFYRLQAFVGWVILLIGAVLLGLLAFSDSFVLNNEFSAKTVHLEKMHIQAQAGQQSGHVSADRHWNSLGGMTPYVEYHPVGTFVPAPVSYPIYEINDLKGSSKHNDDVFGGEHYNQANFQMFINNPWSFSVLSSISPIIYLMTLVCACMLSFTQFFVAWLRRHYDDETKKDRLNLYKSYIEKLTLVFFAILVFTRIARQGSLKSTDWGDLKIEYQTMAHIPSVLYSLIILGLYYMHLKQTDKDNYWTSIHDGLLGTPHRKMDQFDLYDDLSHGCTACSDACTNYRGKQTKQDAVVNGNIVNPGALYDMNMHVNMKPLFNSMMYTAPHSMSVPMQNLPPSGTRNYTTAAPVSLQYIAQTAQKLENDRTMLVLQTNEVSVFVCVMLLLGGLADLGSLSGFIMEVEAQLIILSIVSFCVLEISHMQFKSYVVYCIDVSDICEQFSTEFGKLIYIVSAFVDAAVLIFQILFVITWVTTRNLLRIDHNFYPFFISLLLLVCFYIFLKVIAWLWKFVDILRTKNGNNFFRTMQTQTIFSTTEKWFSNILALLEYLSSCLFIFVVFSIILDILNITDTPEKSLIFQEQTMYQSSTRTSYMPPPSGQECVLPDIYFKDNFMNTTMCKKKDGIQGDKYNPVSMKDFSWTRFLVLQNYLPNGKFKGIACKDSCPPASLLFCTNGFEQKWGQCKYGVNGVLPPPEPWNGLELKD